MNESRVKALQQLLEEQVGAEIVVQPDSSGLRAGLRSFFADLSSNEGPVFAIVPHGLRGHRVSMKFGKFSQPVLEQIRRADAERRAVARTFLEQLAAQEGIELNLSPSQDLEDWTVTGPESGIEIIVRNIDKPGSEAAILNTAAAVIVPMMAALAELIGYDEAEPAEFDLEGRVSWSTVKRRERSPRNRLLCLSIHGHKCAACGARPDDIYGRAGMIIEVHHLEPVSNLARPKAYNPRSDLVPLCPNCHRAAHTRRPHPYTPAELRELMSRTDD